MKLVILSDKLSEENEIRVVRLKHPRTLQQMPYVIADARRVYELVTHSQDPGSVFIDDLVVSESCVNMSSRFNVNYFILSYLTDLNESKFDSVGDFMSKLSSFLTDGASNDCLSNWQEFNKEIFEIKEDKFEIKINKNKVIEWLTNKTELLTTKLASISTNTEKSKSMDDNNKFKQEAFELVAQYIKPHWSDLLHKELNLVSPPLGENTSANKRHKSSAVITLD